MQALGVETARELLTRVRSAGLDVALCGGALCVTGWYWQSDLAHQVRDRADEIVALLREDTCDVVVAAEAIALAHMERYAMAS